VAEETVVQEEQGKPAKGGAVGKIGKVLMIVVLALVSSAGGGVVSFMLMKRMISLNPPGDPKEHSEADAEKIAEMLHKSAVLALEPFVVNLADPDAPRYLRIKVSLMVDDKTKEKELAENQALQQKVRDVILQSLTAKTSQELINEEGKNKLRHEIQEKITMYFKEPKLVDVMFTEFVIQL
jgi:flagellar FliL protein